MKGSVAHGKSEAERVVICGECRGEFCGSCWKTNLLKRLVSELVERAGIGRVSFYRNFSN